MFVRRLVLLATPRQIGVLDWRPARMHWLGEFSATAGGLAAFSKVVARHAHLPALLVVDTVDEDYRNEILPHVEGQARDEMLTRKLKQVFRNARFTGAWRQGRETAGRRDDRYLLATLTDTDWLTPWLTVLQRENIPLAGITPLALACQHLLAKLRIQEPHTLLACRLNTSLRLSYYSQGQLRFSRLIALDAPTQMPVSAADEIAKTQLYLTGQRILPRDSRLHVLLLDPGGTLDSARAELNTDPAFSAHIVSLSSVARALRMPEDFLAATPDIAPLAAIAGDKPSLNLAPPELLKRHVEFSWRRALNAAAGALALLGLGATAVLWLYGMDLKERARQLTLQQQDLAYRHRATVHGFPVQDVAPEQLVRIVKLGRLLDTRGDDIPAVLAAVSRALDAAPDISLGALEWSEAGPAPGGGTQVRLEASIDNFDGNYRTAMNRIEGLMQTLQSVPSLHDVRLQSGPVDAGSGSTLSGKTPDADTAERGVARFKISLLYREARP